MKCILCKNATVTLHTKQDNRRGELRYFFCNTEAGCGLIFLDPAKRIGKAEEKARYDTHNNADGDGGYADFLKRLTDKLLPLLQAGDVGLDFGCGPEPVLARIMEEAGYSTENYDPYYFPSPELLERQYNFITASEVLEHVYEPNTVFTQLHGMLQTGGYLAIMTKLIDDPARFADWWYHRDKTHVCFYGEKTFTWLAQDYGLDIVLQDNNVCIFRLAA